MSEDWNVAAGTIARWRDDPIKFVVDNFKVEPDDWQADVLRAFADPNQERLRIALQACAGPGKSTALAWCGCNFLACYTGKGEHPKGAAVSITGENLKDNLWSEFAKWRNRSPFMMGQFVLTSKRLFARHHPETWFISARSFPKTANAEQLGRTLSGLHSEYVLYLIDESGDMPISILKAAEQGLSRCKFGRIIQAGNPTSHTGMLYTAVTEQSDMWYPITITGDPDDPNRCPRIDIDQARKMIELYGRDDPWVMSYILGQFPPTAVNQLLGPDEVNTSMKRGYKKEDFNWSQKRLGIDVARFGGDKIIIFPRQGVVAMSEIEVKNPDTFVLAARVAKIKADWGSEMEFFDDTGGYAGGVIDALKAADLDPQAINFSGKAMDSRYFNLRSEMWFKMALWVKKRGALPNRPSLRKELTTPTYRFFESKIRVEEKDQMVARLGYSPDMADALALTFAIEDMPAGSVRPWESPEFQGRGGGGDGPDVAKMDYDHHA